MSIAQRYWKARRLYLEAVDTEHEFTAYLIYAAVMSALARDGIGRTDIESDQRRGGATS